MANGSVESVCDKCRKKVEKGAQGDRVYCSGLSWPTVVEVPQPIGECDEKDISLLHLLIGIIKGMVNNTRSRVRS
jgi:hypothetical protein